VKATDLALMLVGLAFLVGVLFGLLLSREWRIYRSVNERPGMVDLTRSRP
jgi:uncharacterized protein YneF (UPF0154 family)